MLAKIKMKTMDIDSSRQDLVTANAALDAILARELESTDTTASFNAWRAERDAAIAEIERLSKLIERLESSANDETLREQQTALQKRVDAQRKSNDMLARRIREEGGPAIEKLLELARDVATAAVVDAEINAKLSGDAEKIASADAIARYHAPAPREVIAEKPVALWVFASNGSVVGGQGDVVPTGGDGSTGFLQASLHKTQVIRRKFRSITYREAEARQPLVPFFAALRLPSLDGPGLIWDPRDGFSAAAALEALKQRPKAAEREILTELVPAEPFVSLPASAGWGRAGDI
jgi:hypothetical protein